METGFLSCKTVILTPPSIKQRTPFQAFVPIDAPVTGIDFGL